MGFILMGISPYPLNNRRFVAVRLTDVELNLLDQGAACFSISRSEYLRKLLLEKQINHRSSCSG
ncbi:plasmid mobilization protein [Blautia massiliensis (ex Durand et al. 2017)]|uniref:plasmid mobilization protein n=1 Tax=Blautia massiliensis (ex Durand et al. 2017) TaxID=1737424 RepID=UPI003B50FA34